MEAGERPGGSGSGVATWPAPALPAERGRNGDDGRAPQEAPQARTSQAPWMHAQSLLTQPGPGERINQELANSASQWPSAAVFPQRGTQGTVPNSESQGGSLPRPGSWSGSQDTGQLQPNTGPRLDSEVFRALASRQPNLLSHPGEKGQEQATSTSSQSWPRDLSASMIPAQQAALRGAQDASSSFSFQESPGLQFLSQPWASGGSHAQHRGSSELGSRKLGGRAPSSPALQALGHQAQTLGGSGGSQGNALGGMRGQLSNVYGGSIGNLHAKSQRQLGMAGASPMRAVNLTQMLDSRLVEEHAGSGNVALVLRRDSQEEPRLNSRGGEVSGGNAAHNQQQWMGFSAGAQQLPGSSGGLSGGTGLSGQGPQNSGTGWRPGGGAPQPQYARVSTWPGAAALNGPVDAEEIRQSARRQQWQQWGNMTGSGAGGMAGGVVEYTGQTAQPNFPGNFLQGAPGRSSPTVSFLNEQGPATPLHGTAAAAAWQLHGSFPRGPSSAPALSSPSLPKPRVARQPHNGPLSGQQLQGSYQAASQAWGQPVSGSQGRQQPSSSMQAPNRSTEGQQQHPGLSAPPGGIPGLQQASMFSQGVLKQLRTPLAQAALSASQAPQASLQQGMSQQGAVGSMTHNGAHSERQSEPAQTSSNFDRSAFLVQLQRHWQEERHLDFLAGKWSTPRMPPEDFTGKAVDLAALYQAVCARGGYEKVTRRKWWRPLALDCLGGDPDRIKLGHEAKCAYEVYLKSFAERYFDPTKIDEAVSDEVGRASMKRFPPKGQGDSQLSVTKSWLTKGAKKDMCLLKSRRGGKRLEIGGQAANSGVQANTQHRPNPAATEPPSGQALQPRWQSASSSGRPTLQGPPLHIWPSAAPTGVQQQVQRQIVGAMSNLQNPAQKRPGSVPPMLLNAAAKKRKLMDDQRAAVQQQQRVPGMHQQHMQQQQQMAAQANAQSILSRIAPSPGPVLAVPERLSAQQVEDMVKALDSGVDTNVAWALNALSVVSFSTSPDLLLAQHARLTPALVRVVRQGLPANASAPERIVDGHFGGGGWAGNSRPLKQSDIWTAKGWWWEREGLFSDEGLADERLTWAVCASNVLRNLAGIRGNESQLVVADLLGMLVECLEARGELEWPPLNELVGNLLELLRCVSFAVVLPPLEATGDALVLQLSRLAEWGSGPLRLRASAICALISLMLSPSNVQYLPAALGGQGSSLVDSIDTILTLHSEDVIIATRAEAAGGSGSIYVPHSTPSEQDLRIAAQLLKAEAQHTTLQALMGLLRMSGATGDVIKHSFFSRPSALHSLVHMVIASLPCPDGAHAEAAVQLPPQLQTYADQLESQVMYGAIVCLHLLKAVPQGALLIKGLESKLAVAAMAGGPTAHHIASLVAPPRQRG